MVVIRYIKTYTLTKDDFECETLEDTKDFLSKKLFKRKGIFHYKNKGAENKTLLLFKYQAKLIGSGIVKRSVKGEIEFKGHKYDGYLEIDLDSITIFKKGIELDEFKKIYPEMTFTRDTKVPIAYKKRILEMIEENKI